MKYTNLTKSEIRELLGIRIETLFVYIITLLIISLSAYLFLQPIIKTYLSTLFVMFLAIAYTAYTLYANQRSLKEIIFKQKKVYQGVLSCKSISKTNKKRKYIFNMDGLIFFVTQEEFEYIQEGDFVKFHVSSYTKHLFRVEKGE